VEADGVRPTTMAGCCFVFIAKHCLPTLLLYRPVCVAAPSMQCLVLRCRVVVPNMRKLSSLKSHVVVTNDYLAVDISRLRLPYLVSVNMFTW